MINGNCSLESPKTVYMCAIYIYVCEVESIYSKINLGRLKLNIIFSGEKQTRPCVEGCSVHPKMFCNSNISVQQTAKAKQE